MIIKSVFLHNPKYKKLNLPKEDFALIKRYPDKTVAAVSDGITRDPKGSKFFPDRDKPEFIELLKSYPRPSPAYEAAMLFCSSFCKYSKNNDLKVSFELANKDINRLNKKPINYLDNDFAGCVASAVIIEDNDVSWGFITDCGLAHFNSDGKLIFKTKEESPTKLIDEEAKKRGLNWNNPLWRAYVRKHYRNNISKLNSYGALTGEKSAEHYIRTGKSKLGKGDYLLLYSDGMKPIIDSKSFNPKSILKNVKKYFIKNSRYIAGGEGTIIFIKYQKHDAPLHL